MPSKDADFIVVGGGPCGIGLATRLANAPSKPSVLLIEAGGRNDDPSSLNAGDRNTFWAMPKGLELDHGYKTVPQKALKDRELQYHRGKGLGGSTATNMGVWDYGSSTDHDEWARLVGDDSWKWSNVEGRYQQIASCHDLTPTQYKNYVQPHPQSHNTHGSVDVTYASTWDPCLPIVFEAAKAFNVPLSSDINSGEGIGIGVAPATVHGKRRVTAASAYLGNKVQNLQVLTDSPVERVVFEGQKARGVELAKGERRYASKEVILCAGAIDTPKLLLLSGIGAASELAKHQIPVVLDQPSIGMNLQDHPILRIAAVVDREAFKARPLPARPEEDIAAAAQGYLKVDPSQLPALSSLDAETRAYLEDKRTPTHELLLRITPHPAQPEMLLWVAAMVSMNAQSRGSVSLKSSDQSDPPCIDLNFLSHPYDLQVAVEAVRSTAPLLRESPSIPTTAMPIGPKSMETADIEEFVRANLGHLWHAAGSVRMGKAGAKDTCVTPDFRVEGVQGLRVADLSVAPIIPSNHPQSTCYLIADLAAERIIVEYGL